MKNTIINKLKDNFKEADINVKDLSHLHAGHNPQAKSGNTHFHIIISSTDFAGKSRLYRQRLVNNAIGKEIISQIHALSMECNE